MVKKTRGVMAKAPFRFGPATGVAYFEELDWKPVETEALLHAAYRFGRLQFPYRFAAYLPEPDPRNPGNKRWSAVTRLAR